MTRCVHKFKFVVYNPEYQKVKRNELIARTHYPHYIGALYDVVVLVYRVYLAPPFG